MAKLSPNILITGNSSGLGYALAEGALGEGYAVYGLSRRECALHHAALRHVQVDLAQLSTIQDALARLLSGVEELAVVYLNAAILGRVQSMPATTMPELQRIMDINVWSNKLLLDGLIKLSVRLGQVVLVSSGAAVSGGYGWSGYSLSKATLNMLAQLYAHELPQAHVCAVAPGLVDTPMQAEISDAKKVDAQRFPSFGRLRAVRAAGQMPSATTVAQQLSAALPRIRRAPSGSFVDLREMN